MSRRPPILTLQGWLLAVLLPALGLLIVAYAILVYGRLNDFIVAGFDAKMTAVSTTTAGFIDPHEHQRLMEPLPITNMTHDPADPRIWALDSSRHELMRIRPEDGMAEDTGIKVPPEIDAISNDLNAGELLLGDTATGRFVRFSTNTRQITPAFSVEPPIHATGTIMRRNSLYIAGRDLRAVDLTTGKVRKLSEMPETLRDLTYDLKRNALWGLSERGDELLDLDPATGAVRRRVKLSYEKSTDPTDAPPPRVELRALVFERKSQTLFGSTTSLMPVDPDTGVISLGGYLPAFGQEQGAVYRRYAAPMTRIMARAKITYLYTQMVEGRDRITYGLDGTQGKDHSPLLSTDIVREAEVAGIQRLMTAGTEYVSPLEPWPPWGILKSSFAPIFDDQGRPVAMAGADVNAGLIQYKTRRALVITFGFGAAMLILGGALALAVSRRLTGPLNTIKTAALRAAAGDYAQHAEVARPRELHRLARRFTAVSATLAREMHDLKESLSARQAARDRAGLLERLARIPALASSAPPDSSWAWGGLGSPRTATAGGAVRAGDRALAWIAPPSADLLKTAARRAEIAVTAQALLIRHGSDPAALGRALETLSHAEVSAWALLTPAGMHARLRGSGLLFRRMAGAWRSEAASEDFSASLRLEPGEALALAGPAAPFDALAALEPARSAAQLLASWRTAAGEETPGSFAIISIFPSP